MEAQPLPPWRALPPAAHARRRTPLRATPAWGDARRDPPTGAGPAGQVWLRAQVRAQAGPGVAGLCPQADSSFREPRP